MTYFREYLQIVANLEAHCRQLGRRGTLETCHKILEIEVGLLCHELFLFDGLDKKVTFNLREERDDEVVYSFAVQQTVWSWPRPARHLKRLAILGWGPVDDDKTIKLVDNLSIDNRIDELAVEYHFKSLDQLKQIITKFRPREFMGNIDIEGGVGFTDVLALFEGFEMERIQCAITVSTDDPNLPVDNFLGQFNDFYARHPDLFDLCITYHHDKMQFFTYDRRNIEQTKILHEAGIPEYDLSSWKFIKNSKNFEDRVVLP